MLELVLIRRFFGILSFISWAKNPMTMICLSKFDLFLLFPDLIIFFHTCIFSRSRKLQSVADFHSFSEIYTDSVRNLNSRLKEFTANKII